MNCAKKIGLRCFAYFALASWIALFPYKGAWYWNGSSCNAGLRLDSGQLCHGRQFRAWLWTGRFWDQKVGYCYTNGFLFHFRVFSNFLSKLGPFKICGLFLTTLKERGYHMLNVRERWDVKDMFLDLTSQILIFLLFWVNRSCLMRVFPQSFFFKQYGVPSTEIFVWPSFHFHNFTQRFFLFWLAQLAERPSAGREVAGSNPGRTNTQGL